MIVVVDYGMGNLRSVSKALEHLGANVKVSSEHREIESADKLVLPGVGAFGDAVAELKKRRLDDAVRSFLKRERPFFGICLGLQLLFHESEEAPGISGFDFFRGEVRRFRDATVKIPHMGWNSIRINRPHCLLAGVPDGSFFYFVHSFYAAPDCEDGIVAGCRYGADFFPAIVGSGTVFATQFHPEKSQAAGLRILKNFTEWNP
jgi:glutamine amidotransferase